MLAGSVLVACLAVLAEASQDRSSETASTLIVLLAAAAAVAVMEIVLLMRLRRRFKVRLLARIAAANRLALPHPEARLAAPTPWPGSTPGADRTVNVTYSAARIWAMTARLISAVAAAVIAGALGAADTAGVLRVLCLALALAGALAALAVACLAFRLLVHWVLPHRPVMVLDQAGVHFPAISFTLPWPELTEIRLFPMPPIRSRKRGVAGERPLAQRGGPDPAASRGKILIAFVPAHPAEVLSALRPNRLRSTGFERALRLYGTPLTIADRLLGVTGESIVDAAARYGRVLVRRYENSAPD